MSRGGGGRLPSRGSECGVRREEAELCSYRIWGPREALRWGKTWKGSRASPTPTLAVAPGTLGENLCCLEQAFQSARALAQGSWTQGTSPNTVRDHGPSLALPAPRFPHA